MKLIVQHGRLTVEVEGADFDAVLHDLLTDTIKQAREQRKIAADYEAVALSFGGYSAVKAVQLEVGHNAGDHASGSAMAEYDREQCPMCIAEREVDIAAV